METRLIAKFVVSRCTFCKLRRNFGCFCSVNHRSGPLRKHMFTCDWCISIHACDRPVSGNNRLVFFEDFPDLSYSCLLQEYSNVYLLLSTKSPLIIAISSAILEQSRVILSFVFAGQANSAPPPPDDWRKRKTHSKFANAHRDTTNLAISYASLLNKIRFNNYNT